MKISSERLKQIIKEELEQEGILDTIGSKFKAGQGMMLNSLTKKYPLKVVNNSLQLDPAKFVDMKQNQGPQEVVSKLKLLFIKLKNDETLKSLPSRYISYDLKQQMNSYKSWSEEAGAPELSDFFKQIDQAVVDREEKDRSDKEEAARVQAEKNKAARNKGQFWPNKLDSLIITYLDSGEQGLHSQHSDIIPDSGTEQYKQMIQNIVSRAREKGKISENKKLNHNKLKQIVKEELKNLVNK